MTDGQFWIERWPITGAARDDGTGMLASSADRRIIDAAWRAAQVHGIGPKLLLRDQRMILAEWEPVHLSGKH